MLIGFCQYSGSFFYLHNDGMSHVVHLLFRILGSIEVSCLTVQLSEQEDLIVWMRTAALPTFRKLYGRIEQDLYPNDTIDVVLQNNYNTYSFNGKKMLVLSTTSWLGGKNEFLGIAYLTVGGLCFFVAMLFSLIYLVKPR